MNRRLQNVMLADRPTGAYKMAETSGTTAEDFSGNGIDGTYANTPTLAQKRLIRNCRDKGPSFATGSSESMSMASTAWDCTGVKPWTAEAWILPSQVATNNWVIMGRTDGGPRSGVVMFIQGTASPVKLVVERWVSGSLVSSLTSTTTLTANTRYYVVMTYDGMYMRLYLNGVLEATSSADTNSMPSLTDTPTIAADSVGTAFDGVIMYVGFYGSWLSADRVKAHWYAGNDRKTKLTALCEVFWDAAHWDTVLDALLPVANWKMIEASGTTLEDATTNNLDGTYSGSPTFAAEGPITGEATENLAVTLNGSSQYATVGDNALLDPGDTLSIVAWVFPKSFTPAVQMIICKNTNSYYISVLQTSGYVEFGKQNVGAIAASTVGLTINRWNLVVVTKSTSASTKIWINGRDVTGTVTDRTIVANASDVIIGANAGSQYFTGSMARVALFATALSESNVRQLYQARFCCYGYSFIGLQSPGLHYEAKLQGVSTIRRQMPLFGSGYSSPSVDVTFQDSQRTLLDLVDAGYVVKLVVKLVRLCDGVTSAQSVFSGRVVNFDRRGSLLTLAARDTRYEELLNQPLSGDLRKVTTALFPNLDLTKFTEYVPQVIGRLQSIGLPYGEIPAFRIDNNGADGTKPYVYLLTARPMGAVGTNVTSTPQSTNYGSRSSDNPHTATYDSIDFGCFKYAVDPVDSARPMELEIVAEINGLTADDNTASQPIMHFITALERFVELYFGIDVSEEFDTDLQDEAKALVTELGLDDDVPPDSALTDLGVLGAYIHDGGMSREDLLSECLKSFCAALYMTKAGKFAIFMPTDGPLLRAFTYDTEVMADTPSLNLADAPTAGTIWFDRSGNGLHATLTNGPTLGNAGPLVGRDNFAVTLNGTDEYAVVADNAALDPGDTFSVEAWIYVTSLAETNPIYSKGTGGLEFYVGATDGLLKLYKIGTGLIVESTVAISVDSWHHVVATKTGSTVVLYIDAIPVTGTITNQTIVATASDVHIGREASDYYAGRVARIALYSTVLSAARVRAHYDAGRYSMPSAELVVSEKEILKGALSLRPTGENATTLKVQHMFKYAAAAVGSGISAFWRRSPEYEIPGERGLQGGSKVLRTLNLKWVRRTDRAIDIARLYGDVYSAKARKVDFNLPLGYFEDVELGVTADVTHWQAGLDAAQARVMEYGIDVTPGRGKVSVSAFQPPQYTTARDNFNRANGALGSNYLKSESSSNRMTIVSYRCKFDGGGFSNSRGLAYRVESFGDDQVARCRFITQVSASYYGGVFCRGSGIYTSFTGYVLVRNPTYYRIEVRKFVAADLNGGGSTVLMQYDDHIYGQVLELRVKGSRLELWGYGITEALTGELLTAVTDTAIPRGSGMGLVMWDNNTAGTTPLYCDDAHFRDF